MASIAEQEKTKLGLATYLKTREDGVRILELSWELANNSKAILYTLTEEWQEAPIMKWDNVSVRENGELMNTTIGFGLNKVTGTWSLVEFISEDWACIIANGWGFTVFTPEQNK